MGTPMAQGFEDSIIHWGTQATQWLAGLLAGGRTQRNVE
jgi:hypothetical protein